MSGTQPVAVYAMKVPAGDVMVPAVPDSAAMFRLSMAAIDPDAEPEFEEGREKKTPRATLKLIRVPADLLDDDSDDSDIDSEEDGDEESSDEEELNGGPSDLSKAKKPNKLDLAKAIAKQESGDEQEEDDSEEEAAAKSALMKIMKGKGKADINGDNAGGENDDSLELEEIVVCTLDPEKVLRSCALAARGLRLTSFRITSNLSTFLLEKTRRFFSRSPVHTRCTLQETTSSQPMTVRVAFTATRMKTTTTFLQTRTNSTP